ncbi:hypothetical protein APSETT444_010582 [Aspergillus pseudonomiae]
MSTYIFQFGGIVPTPENPFDVAPAKPMVDRTTGPENQSADKKKMINEALDDLRDNYAFGDLLFCFTTKENPDKLAKSPI